jgi:hypothetical protein
MHLHGLHDLKISNFIKQRGRSIANKLFSPLIVKHKRDHDICRWTFRMTWGHPRSLHVIELHEVAFYNSFLWCALRFPRKKMLGSSSISFVLYNIICICFRILVSNTIFTQNTTQKTNNWTTRISLKIEGECRCSSDTRRITVKRQEYYLKWKCRDWFVFMAF